MGKYRYTLIYEDNDSKLTYEFPADITLEDLRGNLRNFLCGCSWSEAAAQELLQCE